MKKWPGSRIALYSGDPSSNPTDRCSFYNVKLFENNLYNTRKEAGNGPFFSNRNFREIFLDLSRIQTRIDRVEGKHADHCTTTKAQSVLFSYLDVKVIFLAHVILKSLSYLS